MRCQTAVLTLLVMLLGPGPSPAQQTSVNPHGRIEVPCTDCHTADAWKPARISERFDHDRFGFALEDAHRSAPCTSCHRSLEFRAAPRDCVSCHQDLHLGEFGTDCTRCHQTRSFTDRADQIRAHQQTRFPLDGAHAAVECLECHAPAPAGGLTWRNRPVECVACHLDEFHATRTPDHAVAGFPRDCQSCHTRSGWSGARFDHSTTRYPLLGAHAQAGCPDCHAQGVFRGLDQACVSCHAADFAAAAEPPHQAAGFPTDCTTCHSGTVQWHGASFDHGRTQFALTGAHRATSCSDCHTGGAWQGLAMDCVACHRAGFDNSTNPPHGAAGFATQCASCHTTSAWSGATFDHLRFPLTGAHLSAGCNDCHADGVYSGKPAACLACHKAQFDGARVPDHRASGYSTDCTSCHTTAAWTGARFDHSQSQFALTGAHLAVSCSSCHGDGVYDGKPTTCLSCHRPVYDATTQPPHASLGFPTDCAACHTTTAWPGGRYDHTLTRFPLTGAHVTATCGQCHGDGVYRGKTLACAGCHQSDYDGALDPNHRTARFPTDCAACHSTQGWEGARFDHDGQYFPIYSGKHAGQWASCATCHTTSTSFAAFTCLTCHEHNQTKMDDTHKERAGYRYQSTACLSCHPRGTK